MEGDEGGRGQMEEVGRGGGAEGKEEKEGRWSGGRNKEGGMEEGQVKGGVKRGDEGEM